jgi:two-component system chemotaxis sensor kinase CheA
LHLREQLGLVDSAADSPNARSNVVVAQIAGHRAGIVVDALLGEYQTVIKPLGALFAHLQGISGSTILGNGEVALILDAAPLISRASRSAQGRQAPALSN